jgi:hypothetical protein
MKALMLMTGSGPMVVLSSHSTATDPALLSKLHAKGIDKFIAYELAWDDVERLYGGHFQVVVQDLHETDDLRVLDYNGHRVFQLFRLSELGEPLIYDPAAQKSQVFMD